MNLIYVASGDVSVYESQVVSLLDYYLKTGNTVTLVQGFKTEKEKKTLKEKTRLLQNDRYNIVWYRSEPCYLPFVEIHTTHLRKAILSCSNLQNAVIHVRGEETGFYVKKILNQSKLNVPILIDIRGVVYEEVKYRINNLNFIKGFRFRCQKSYFSYIYNRLFQHDQTNIAISSVSPLINNYLETHFPQCRYRKFFHPNIAGVNFKYTEEGRIKIRKKYGIKNDAPLAICSTNGNGLWQKDYLVIRHLIEKGVKVLNLSKYDPHIPGCITTKASFAEMPEYLSAADFAVLWRDDTFMNNSASPSKFSEFAVMGLCVIHNKSVEVATKYILLSKAGFLVNQLSDIDNLTFNVNEIRRKRTEFIMNGRKQFSIEALGPSYIKIYENLLANKNNIQS